MSAPEMDAAERLLAKLVAKTFAADHPELLAPMEHAAEHSGPRQDAADGAGAAEEHTG